MSVSSHRKLNVEQLINLAQVYWDDPTKLMEISDASEGRVDPAAQLLFGAISSRLERLRGDAFKALAEETPDLQALIAARLGMAPPAGNAEADAVADAEEEEGKPSRKRGQFVITGGAAALLLGLLAWWLWPVREVVEEEALVREAGAEIQEQGERVEEDVERRGAGRSALPPGRRRGEFPDPRDFDPRARFSQPADADDAPIAQRRRATGGAAADPDETEEPRAARSAPTGAGSGGAVRGGGDGAAQPAAAGAAGRAANAKRAGAGASGGRGAGADLSEAQLQCFLSDSRPNACAEPPAGRRGSAGGPSGGGGAGGGGAPAASASAAGREAGNPPSSDPSSSPRGGSPPLGNRGSGGGSGGGPGGGGAAGSDGGSGPPPAPGRPAAQASAGGEGGGGGAQAQRERQRWQAQQPTPQNEPPPDPDCPTEPPQGRVVFIFDGSISMGLPLGIDPAEEDRLDDGTRRRDPETRQEYRALLGEPGPKRMGRAQQSFAEAAEELPDFVELGLVVFQECRDIRQVGIFDAARRGSAIDYVHDLVPRGRTPLAQSLMTAQEMLGDKPASIVLLTDGREFCSGDPCAVAEHVKATRPGVPIHIIDIAGQGRTECVAEITGGRSYAPAETDDLTKVIRAAFRGAAPRCGG